jgi:hypothetical protein
MLYIMTVLMGDTLPDFVSTLSHLLRCHYRHSGSCAGAGTRAVTTGAVTAGAVTTGAVTARAVVAGVVASGVIVTVETTCSAAGDGWVATALLVVVLTALAFVVFALETVISI